LNRIRGRVPNRLRKKKELLLRVVELAGDKVYPDAVVMLFQNYVKEWGRFARKSKSEKHEREAELLVVLEKGVVAKCRMGLKGCAVAIYEFLTNVAGNRRTQQGMRCMSGGNAQGFERRWQGQALQAPQQRAWGNNRMMERRQQWNGRGSAVNRSMGRGGFSRGFVHPDLKCWICEGNHYAERCALRK
jgi:hypothetical protein